jgi:Flp pilus assembly protein TadG
VSLARFIADRSGASTLLTILALPVLLGFTAFAIDGGMAYMARRNAQNAADSAAFSAATAWGRGDTNLLDQARGVALQYGLKDGTDGVNIAVNRPPATGPNAGNPKAVEVIVTRPMSTFFASIFGGTAGTLRARSVSLAGRAGDICVLVLNPTATWAVTVNGFPTINLSDCALQVNSGAAQAMLVNGSPHITADQIRLVGSYLLNGGPILNLKNGWKTGAEAIPDPYAEVPMPKPGPCKPLGTVPQSGNWTAPTSPGGVTTYCTDLILNGTTKATFPKGIYIFTKGKTFTVNGSVSVTGAEVSFVFAKEAGSTTTVTWNGTGKLTLEAPHDGPMQGLLMFTDPAVDDMPGVTINGANDSQLAGALDLPKARVTINGTNAVAGSCLQLIADTIVYNGGGEFGLTCGAIGTKPIGGLPSGLVE